MASLDTLPAMFLILALQTGQLDAILCFDCNSGIDIPNRNCKADATINIRYTDTSKCGGKCVTRTNIHSYDPTVVFRGCSLSYSIPGPEDLPVDGCYTYQDDTYCICSTSFCNRAPIGKHTGIQLDSEVKKAEQNKACKPNVRPAERQIVCHVCASHAPETGDNINCPGDGSVNSATSYKENCTGRCYSRTDIGNNKKVVYRGCTDVQYNMPDPFPPDGCYQHYNLDTWCICNCDLCNSGPLGKHNGAELDDHLYTEDVTSLLRPTNTLILVIIVTCLFIMW